jgi:hypothetical protein
VAALVEEPLQLPEVLLVFQRPEDSAMEAALVFRPAE